MKGQVKIVVIVIAVIFISAIVSFVSAVALAGRSEKIFPGISVGGVNLGDKTKEEAEQALTEYTNQLRNKSIIVNYNDRSSQFKLTGIDLQANTASVINKAWMAGRQGGFLLQWQERNKIAKNGLEIPFEFSVSKDKLKSVLENMTKDVRTPPRDAKIVITPEDTIQIVESSYGKGIDINDAFDQLNRIIKEGEKPEINLFFVDVKPAVTTEDIKNMNVNGILSSFNTQFDPKKTNRTFNVKVAAVALDGQMLKPGETFSFNKIVGPRSQEAGYKEAKVIINNEFVESLGGGVCQVSSTLYNALLRADIGILERSSHSLVVKYVPLGQDAAVAYGLKDLRFKNNLPCAIIMKTSVKGNNLVIKLFGDVGLKKTISVTNSIVKVYPHKIVYKYDPTLPKGKQVISQDGENGYRVTSKMMVYQNGKLIGQKQLSSSYYKPLDRIILIGTKAAWSKPSSGTKIYSLPGTTQPRNPGQAGTPPAKPPAKPPVKPPVVPPVNPPPIQDPPESTEGDDLELDPDAVNE